MRGGQVPVDVDRCEQTAHPGRIDALHQTQRGRRLHMVMHALAVTPNSLRQFSHRRRASALQHMDECPAPDGQLCGELAHSLEVQHVVRVAARLCTPAGGAQGARRSCSRVMVRVRSVMDVFIPAGS